MNSKISIDRMRRQADSPSVLSSDSHNDPDFVFRFSEPEYICPDQDKLFKTDPAGVIGRIKPPSLPYPGDNPLAGEMTVIQ